MAVALGADADSVSLEALARGGGGVVVPYVPGQRVSAAALDVRAAGYGEVLRDPEVELPSGLTQVTPSRLDPIRAGGETIVVARMTDREASGSLKLKGKVGSERFEQTYPLKIVTTSNAGNAFVPRLFAAAKIAELDRDGGEAAKPVSIALSRTFHVASRFTSLLVLESETMFKAFGVDHTANGGQGFTGEQGAESANADGDVAVDDAEDEHNDNKDGAKGRGEKAAPQGHGKHHARAAAADVPEGNAGPSGVAAANPFADGAARGASGGSVSRSGGGRAADAEPPAAPAPAAAATAAPSAMAKEERKADQPRVTVQAPPAPPAEAQREATKTPAPAKKAARPIGGDDKSTESEWDRRQRDVAMRRRGLVAMKKVFDRKTAFDAVNTFTTSNASKLVVAEAASRAEPDSRDRTTELFALYATSGRLGEAQELTARWAGRDALDPDALLARADLAARQGDRARAIRVLGGLVDVRPNDRATQARLADLHEAANEPALACEHRISLAEIAPNETKVVADAVRCTRALGMSELASRPRARRGRDAAHRDRDGRGDDEADPEPARRRPGDRRVDRRGGPRHLDHRRAGAAHLVDGHPAQERDRLVARRQQRAARLASARQPPGRKLRRRSVARVGRRLGRAGPRRRDAQAREGDAQGGLQPDLGPRRGRHGARLLHVAPRPRRPGRRRLEPLTAVTRRGRRARRSSPRARRPSSARGRRRSPRRRRCRSASRSWPAGSGPERRG